MRAIRVFSCVLAFLVLLTGAIGTAGAASYEKARQVTTDSAIVLDSDRAILLGTSSSYSGLKEMGFRYGLSADDLNKKAASRPVEREKMNVLVTGLKPETTYYVQAYVKTSKKTYKGSVVSFKTPAAKTWSAQDAVFNNSDARYNFIFGTATKYYKMSAPPWGFNGAKEAAKHIVTIKVKTWKLSNGKKVTAKRTLQVNYKLAAQVKAIFSEIYALNIKFPIMALKGYSYRRMVVPWIKNNPYISQHSFGTCIDVNKPYNLYYRNKDKRNKKSPYYIPKSVIAVFEKYGWTWGGNFKQGLDTMHFQYLGPELMK
jgi:hypothetical protein